MNLIYITGAPRCGKTTFANTLMDSKTSILSLDSFSKSVRSVFTEFTLYEDYPAIRPVKNNDKFLKLVKVYINNFFNDFNNHTLIVEGCHFSPYEFHTEFPMAEIIALGRTSSMDEIVSAIMEKDWMSNLSKDKINCYAELIYNYSVELKAKATFYKYIDI